MSVKAFLLTDWESKRWIQLAEPEDKFFSYVKVGVDKPELLIEKEGLYSEAPISLSELEEIGKNIQKTGKSPKELVQACKRVYEKIEANQANYADLREIDHSSL